MSRNKKRNGRCRHCAYQQICMNFEKEMREGNGVMWRVPKGYLSVRLFCLRKKEFGNKGDWIMKVEEKRRDRMCPIRVHAGKEDMSCDEELCEWWIRSAECCAVALSAISARDLNEKR